MIAVLPCGDFWNRQPLAYPPIAARLAGRVGLTDRAEEAQILLVSHPLDLLRHGRRLAGLVARRPALRTVLLSEEPFWDTCWADDPFAPYQSRATAAGPLPYAVLNHATAAFLGPREIPYFLLTDPGFIAAYRERFARNAGVAAAEWWRHFREAPVGAAFMAEKRDRARHDPAFPDRGVWGLSVWRTRLARACTGEVLRAGKGWEEGPPRQEMPGWHRDKLDRLDRRCRYVSAVENTHMAGYVTEKIFDAFAVGGMPLYVAAPGHAVFDLVGAGGWINLFRREGRGGRLAAPAFDAGRPVAAAEADAYARVQDRLARLFADDAAVARALDRVADGIAAALAALAGRPSG